MEVDDFAVSGETELPVRVKLLEEARLTRQQMKRTMIMIEISYNIYEI